MIESDNPQVEGASINNPDLSSDVNAQQRAISSGSQAYLIAKTLEDNNRERNEVAAKVAKKYNGGLPFNQSDLKNAESDWRNNFPTGFMASIVDRVIPEPVQVIDSARYLTSASLSSDTPDAAKKTELFREKVTKAIRSWNRWKSFNYSLWTEDVLHGAAIVASLDPFSPWPELYRLDQSFLAEGAEQFADDQQIISFKKDYLLHDFVKPIKDKGIAEEAGWDTDAAIEEVNGALPESPITNNSNGVTSNARAYEDAIREGNIGASHSGAKVVETYHLLATESDTGKVTHYMLSRRGDHKVLFQKDDQFDKMSDVACLFTLQPGNGKFYSSKGLGRILLNIHIAIERARNAMFDQLYIAGFKILKTDATQVPQIQLRVRHPFVLISSNATLEAEQIQANVTEFIQADQQLSRWAEQAVGSYITGLTDTADPNKAKTATEASIEAGRDNQAKVAFLSRAWGQFADMIGMITRRLCDTETTDRIAKDLQDQLEKAGLTREEITELANAPAAEVVQDLTQSQNAQIVQSFQVLRGDPSIDQHRLYDRYISALVNPQFAADVLLDEQGQQSQESEAIRQQIIEDVAIMNGESVPVSPRDPHEIHIKVALSELKNAGPGIAQNPHPELLDNANAALVHTQAHIAMWKQQGAKPEQLKPYEQAIKQFDEALTGIAQHLQQASAQAPQAPTMSPDGAGVSGQPTGDQNAPQGQLEPHLLKITSSIAYKDAPDDIKRQIEAAAGFKPSELGAEGNSTLTAPNLQHVQKVASAAAPAQQIAPPPPNGSPDNIS